MTVVISKIDAQIKQGFLSCVQSQPLYTGKIYIYNPRHTDKIVIGGQQ